jgi:hypothetical protein
MSNDRPYEKDCMYCHKQITMSKETGKWLPYEKDGSSHDCRKINGNKKQEITLEMVQKKLKNKNLRDF